MKERSDFEVWGEVEKAMVTAKQFGLSPVYSMAGWTVELGGHTCEGRTAAELLRFLDGYFVGLHGPRPPGDLNAE